MNHASYLRPVGVSIRSIRGARSLNRGSMRLVYRSGGSTMWESAEMSLYVAIVCLPSVETVIRRLSRLDPRKPLLSPHVVEDLEHTGGERRVLDVELLAQAAVVHQVGAGFLAAAVFLEGDLRVGEELAHDVRQLAEADRDPARIVERVARGIGQQDAREDLRDVLDVDQQAHEALARKMHRLAAGGVAHELHVIRGAPDLVGAGDVGGADARDRHRVVLDVLLRLKLVEDLVHGVLARAVWGIVLGRQPVAEVALLPAHRDRAR